MAESSSTSGQLARLTEEVDFLREKARQLQREVDDVCLQLLGGEMVLVLLVATIIVV